MSKVKTRIRHTISANTLFHFTNSADDLLNILRNEFRPHYCLEDWNLKGPVDLLKELPKGVRKNEILLGEQAVPMVCFCDIPLLNVTEHLNFYGDQGIGLSKEWAKSKGISPVLYVHDKSFVYKYLRKFMAPILKIPFSFPNYVNLLELLSFIKPYEGKMFRDGKYIFKKFYDEREWRYVPKLTQNKLIEICRLSKIDI